MPEFDFSSLKEKKEISPEVKKTEKISEKVDLKPAKIEKLIDSKKLKIGSAELNLLSKSLDRTTGFDISNIHISQDDLWLLYRLKFGKGTRTKRSVLLPLFTNAFNKNLEKIKKKNT